MKRPGHGAAAAANPSPTAAVGFGDASRRPVIAIVGGGFSGTCLAIHLLRRHAHARPRVLLIEPRALAGGGLAYAPRDYPYPLNVTAGQMSLDAAHPADFLDFARGQGIQASEADYLPRHVYGEYLHARLTEACSAAGLELRAVHQRARVLQVRQGTGGRWDLWLDDGSSLRSDTVVLALGNAPPATLPQFSAIVSSGRYLDDPWEIGSCAHETPGSVLLVGSGLTMVDAALRLAAIRPRVRSIHVLSRHGLLPASQAVEARPARKPDLQPILETWGSVRELASVLRRNAREVVEAGGDWREVIATLRPQLPLLWRGLDVRQRAAFLRHLRAFWETHRHRVPAGPLAAIRALERLGILTVNSGRLESTRINDGSVEVQWRPRGARRARAWQVDRVVNCTGPDHRVEHSTDPLVRSLLSAGLIRADELQLGLDVAPDGRVISRAGAPVDSLYYIGPGLRARDWEATAVPELRQHAARLARQLVPEEALAES